MCCGRNSATRLSSSAASSPRSAAASSTDPTNFPAWSTPGSTSRTEDPIVNKALLTGGAGFIGGHLTRRLLDDGWAVTLVDNLSRGGEDETLAALHDHPHFALQIADLRDGNALDDIGDDFTHVFHFAALLGVQNVI